jgi:hypothetical protein
LSDTDIVRGAFSSRAWREMKMRALGLWLLGVPLTVIILLALFTNLV